MKIHFVGIGGIGISGVAQFCQDRGDEVSGSDISESEIFPILRKRKMLLFLEQQAENIPLDLDLLVYSEAISFQNPERKAAREKGIPEKSYFEFLGDISRSYKTIAVAGSHGKTTITGMLAAGFDSVDFDPTIFIGSTLREFNGSNYHAGTNDWLVLEACEYRQNFRFLYPDIVVLTEVEWDHPDSYPTEESYFQAFEKFCSSAGTVLFHEDDVGAKRVLQNYTGSKHAVSEDSHLNLTVFGKHNQRNARLALSVAENLDLDKKSFAIGLQNFSGAGRRQEFIGEWNGIRVYDDYGHHPTEIQAVLSSFREKFPHSRIGLIYEPHQFSRTREFFSGFVKTLRQADQIGIFPIYEARDSEDDKNAVSAEKLAAAIPEAEVVQGFSDANSFLSSLQKGDVCLFMGAGKISEFARTFLAQ
ncbi:hypothetical protein K9M59_03350 [Candidatus Gracilibacteria bacterium]|nr:hypothetical protein [Candidatus Gracilibacteria bacterium]MCF7819364.1 hypothetical protein [Candidatus Gracilibacteria bacterium]